MVLELLALFLTAGSGVGLVATLVLWARLEDQRQARLAARLCHQQLLPGCVATVGRGPLPLQATVSDGDRELKLSMDARGATAIWRVSVSCARWAELPRVMVLEERWARGTPGMHHRRHQVVDLAHVGQCAWVVADALPEAASFVESRFATHLLAEWLSWRGLRALELGPQQVTVVLERHGQDVRDVLCAMSSALDVADVLDGRVPARRFVARLPGHAAASNAGGLPLGIPPPALAWGNAGQPPRGRGSR